MALYESKVPNWTGGQVISKVDLERASELVSDTVIKDVQAFISNYGKDVIYRPNIRTEDLVYPHPSINGTVRIDQFMGAHSSGSNNNNLSDNSRTRSGFVLNRSVQDVSVDITGTGVRVDIIQARSIKIDGGSEDRNTVSASNDGDISAPQSNSRVVEKLYDAEIMVKPGTNGVSVAPGTDDGWIKIAEVLYQPSGNNIVIRNVDQHFGGDNTNWTHEANRTQLLNTSYDHRSADVLDHKDGSVTMPKLDMGVQDSIRMIPTNLSEINTITGNLMPRNAGQILKVNTSGNDWVLSNDVVGDGIPTLVITNQGTVDDDGSFENVFGANDGSTHLVDITDRVIVIKKVTPTANDDTVTPVDPILDHPVVVKGTNGAIITVGCSIQYTSSDAVIRTLNDHDIPIRSIGSSGDTNNSIVIDSGQSVYTNTEDGGTAGAPLQADVGSTIGLFDSQSKFGSGSFQSGEYRVISKRKNLSISEINNEVVSEDVTANQDQCAIHIDNEDINGNRIIHYMYIKSGQLYYRRLSYIRSTNDISIPSGQRTERRINTQANGVSYNRLKFSYDSVSNRAVIVANRVDTNNPGNPGLVVFHSTNNSWWGSEQVGNIIGAGGTRVNNINIYEILADDDRLRIIRSDHTANTNAIRIHHLNYSASGYALSNAMESNQYSSTENRTDETHRFGIIKVGNDYYYSYTASLGQVIIVRGVGDDDPALVTQTFVAPSGERSGGHTQLALSNGNLHLYYNREGELDVIRRRILTNATDGTPGLFINDDTIINVASNPQGYTDNDLEFFNVTSGSNTFNDRDDNTGEDLDLTHIWIRVRLNTNDVTNYNVIGINSTNWDTTTTTNNISAYSNITNHFLLNIRQNGSDINTSINPFSNIYVIDRDSSNSRTTNGELSDNFSTYSLSLKPLSNIALSMLIDGNNQGNPTLADVVAIPNVINSVLKLGLYNSISTNGINGYGKTCNSSITTIIERNNQVANAVRHVHDCHFVDFVHSRHTSTNFSFRECNNVRLNGKVNGRIINANGDVGLSNGGNNLVGDYDDRTYLNASSFIDNSDNLEYNGNMTLNGDMSLNGKITISADNDDTFGLTVNRNIHITGNHDLDVDQNVITGSGGGIINGYPRFNNSVHTAKRTSRGGINNIVGINTFVTIAGIANVGSGIYLATFVGGVDISTNATVVDFAFTNNENVSLTFGDGGNVLDGISNAGDYLSMHLEPSEDIPISFTTVIRLATNGTVYLRMRRGTTNSSVIITQNSTLRLTRIGSDS